jgi:hypothetical protein
MSVPAHDSLRVREGVAEIECGDCVENDFEWIGFALPRRACRGVIQAFGTLVDLQSLHSVAALAFLDRVLALAFGADGIRSCSFSD